MDPSISQRSHLEFVERNLDFTETLGDAEVHGPLWCDSFDNHICRDDMQSILNRRLVSYRGSMIASSRLSDLESHLMPGWDNFIVLPGNAFAKARDTDHEQGNLENSRRLVIFYMYLTVILGFTGRVMSTA